LFIINHNKDNGYYYVKKTHFKMLYFHAVRGADKN